MARRKRAGARRRRTSTFKWLRKWWPSVAVRQRWMRAFSRTPATLQFSVLAAVLVALWFGLNWIYQVVRKPSELFFPVSGVLYKVLTSDAVIKLLTDILRRALTLSI